MRRRKFITLLGGAAGAWPLGALAQQAAIPVIGFLGSAALHSYAPHVAAFRQGLKEVGLIEGRDVTIEFRWADNRHDRLPGFAADLVRQQVAVIIAAGGAQSALAAKAATTAIPIVFLNGSDPVELGLAASFNRPGSNITGVTILTVLIAQKRLELARELVPTADVIAWLHNPMNPNTANLTKELEQAARTLGRRVRLLNVSSERNLDAAFMAIAQERIGAVVTSADPIFTALGDQLIALATRQAVPAIYPYREHVVAGGLIGYGPSITDGFRQVGTYAGRILRGAKPEDLPIVQATKFELVINLKAAKALGIEVPTSILLRADEVIE